MSMGWAYPPGAEFDPRAPWNEKEPTEDDDTECPNPSRYCRCEECHKLATVAAHYGIEFEGQGAHDAMSDVRVTAELLRRMHAEDRTLFPAITGHGATTLPLEFGIKTQQLR